MSTDPSVTDIIAHLRSIGINLLAIDFDRTIIDIHTGGRWEGSAEELVPHIRPFFQELIPTLPLKKDLK